MEMFKVFFLEDFVHMGLKDTNLAIRALFLTIDTHSLYHASKKPSSTK